MIMEHTAERDDLLLWPNDYKLSKQKLHRKLSEQDVILDAMTASVKHPEKNVSLS